MFMLFLLGLAGCEGKHLTYLEMRMISILMIPKLSFNLEKGYDGSRWETDLVNHLVSKKGAFPTVATVRKNSGRYTVDQLLVATFIDVQVILTPTSSSISVLSSLVITYRIRSNQDSRARRPNESLYKHEMISEELPMRRPKTKGIEAKTVAVDQNKPARANSEH